MTTTLPPSDQNAERIWTQCAQTIKSQVSEAVWRTTFSGTRATGFARNSLVLQVPTALQKMRIEQRYFPLVRDALSETTPGATLQIDVHPDRRALQADQSLAQASSSAEQVHAGEHAEPTKRTTGSARLDRSHITVNTRLTFDTFVTGTSNRFAHAAAYAVAEQPSYEFNPLFIHGASGLGKTHLLQAITHYVTEHYPDYATRYVTTETFLNEFITAIRTNTQHEFKQRYRSNTMLLVDDIQFLQDKDGLQEEFFHTFNDVLQNGGQIVLSSDRLPNAIPKLENRLRSRFRSGLITDIQPPDLMTRLAILQKKTNSQSAQIPDSVLTFIAENITDSIRELEGALIKVIAYTNLSKEPCTLALAKRLLADLISQTAKQPVTLDLILRTTVDVFGFSYEQLIGPSRRRPLVEARQIAMYVTRLMTDLSYPQIGSGFGNRDHTTVMYACKKIKNTMKDRQDIFERVQEFQDRVSEARS